MHRFRKILVGVDLASADRLAAADLKPPSREAVERAIWLAENTSAELTFFSAIDISEKTRALLENDSKGGMDSVESAANGILAELVQQAKERGVAADSKLEFGTGWLELTRQAIHGQHDLVMVGTRDPNVVQRLFFGSSAMQLIRNCPCAVWVTKPDPVPEDLNILVASDLSDVAADALDLVVSGGQYVDTKIHLLHSVEYPLDAALLRTGLGEHDVDAYRQKVRAEAEQALHEQLSRTDYRTLTNGVQVHVADGPADVAILQAIEKHNIDLLVIGTVARAGIPGLLIGNTCERLLPQVPCSILAVKPADFQSPVA